MVAFIYFVVYLILNGFHGAATNKKLIIDQDGGADDAMAIFMGVLNEKYFQGPEIVAITTTHGNVDEKQAFNNTQRILTVADRRDIPIYRGSSSSLIRNYPSDNFFGYDGLGDTLKEDFKPIAAQKDHAVFGLIEMSKKFKGELIIVTLGALTNIALAKKIDPDFMSRLSHLYIAAGHIYSDDFQEPEFNALRDVESYRIVLEKSDPEKTTVIPFSQILEYQNISKEWRQDILGSINTKIMRNQNIYETKSLNSSSSWSLLDPSAMAIALNEDLIVKDTLYSKNDIILCGEKRGVNTNDFTSTTDANCKVVYKVRKHEYKQFLYDLFSAELYN
ncbi:unnamed protein product, partial [Brenthis ino]